jgi:hypothetical protein
VCHLSFSDSLASLLIVHLTWCNGKYDHHACLWSLLPRVGLAIAQQFWRADLYQIVTVIRSLDDECLLMAFMLHQFSTRTTLALYLLSSFDDPSRRMMALVYELRCPRFRASDFRSLAAIWWTSDHDRDLRQSALHADKRQWQENQFRQIFAFSRLYSGHTTPPVPSYRTVSQRCMNTIASPSSTPAPTSSPSGFGVGARDCGFGEGGLEIEGEPNGPFFFLRFMRLEKNELPEDMTCYDG